MGDQIVKAQNPLLLRLRKGKQNVYTVMRSAEASALISERGAGGWQIVWRSAPQKQINSQ